MWGRACLCGQTETLPVMPRRCGVGRKSVGQLWGGKAKFPPVHLPPPPYSTAPPHLILPPLSLPQVMGLRDQLRGITSCGFLCLLSPSPTLNLPLFSSLPPPGHGSAGSATRTPEASCCAP